MTILDRYVAKLLAQGFGYALGALVAIFSVITLTEELRATDHPGYSIGAAVAYVLLNLATEAYGLLPASALLGALFALGQMMQGNEIVAVQAAGVSPRRFAVAVIAAAAVIGVAGVPFGEWIAAPLSQVARSRRALALSEGRMLNSTSGLWIRDGLQVIQVGEVRPDGSLSGVLVLELDAAHKLRRVLRAGRAFRRGDGWRLGDLRESVITNDGVQTRQAAEADWDAKLAPAHLRALWLQPEDLSMRDLAHTTALMRQHHQNTLSFEIAWLRRASSPIYIVLMVGLALSVVGTVGQREQFGPRLFVGVVSGLAFQLSQQMFTNLGVTAGLPPLLTALTPAAAVLAASFVFFRSGGVR